MLKIIKMIKLLFKLIGFKRHIKVKINITITIKK